MKNRVFIVLICILLLPFIVDAKSCVATVGTGKKVGDEVKCGTESFYVIKHSDYQTKMIAKYNLMVGDKIDYIEITGTPPTFPYSTWVGGKYPSAAFDYCNNLAHSNNYNPYYTYPIFDFDTTELKGCRVYEKIEYEHVVQDSRAIGTKLDGNGKSILPIYGITYMQPAWGYEAMHDGVIKENVYDNNGDLVLEGSSFEKYIKGYKTELERQNVDVKSVNFITLNTTLNLLKDISGEDVEVNLEYGNGENIEDQFIGKMDIKEFIPNNHKWIYDVTYWLGSGFLHDPNNPVGMLSEYNDYYITNEGVLCALGRGECGYFDYPIGNGIRPLVVVENSDISFMREDGTPEDSSDSNNPNNIPIINPKTIAIALVVVLIVTTTIVVTYLVLRKNKNNVYKEEE